MELSQIVELLKKVHPGEEPFDYRKRKPSAEWLQLFNFFNSHSGHHLSMGCGHCYQEVYEFATKYVQSNSVKNA